MNLCVRSALRRCQHGSRLPSSLIINSSILQTPPSSSSSSSYSTSKIAMLSTMPEEVLEEVPEVKSDPVVVLNYVKERKKMREELNSQRKKWHEAWVEQQEAKEIQRKEERRRIVLEKAQRDRVKKQESLKRQAADKERNRIFKQRFEEHLARNFIEFKRRKKAQQERYDRYLTDVNEESKCWLNLDNIDEKITADLFSTQSTTGLVMKYSEHWRWHVMSINLKRIFSTEFVNERNQDGKNDLTKRLDWAAQAENFKKFEVRDFLEEMVTDGRDREHLEELVDKFTKELDYHGAFDDDDFQWYFDLMFEKFTRDHKKNPLRKFDGQTPYGPISNWNQVLNHEERWIAEHFDYPPELDADGKPIHPQELPYVPAEGDEDIIVPQKDPNQKKMIRGKPVNLNRKGAAKKNKKK